MFFFYSREDEPSQALEGKTRAKSQQHACLKRRKEDFCEAMRCGIMGEHVCSPHAAERRTDRMNPVLEDVFLGPLASPSFSQGLRFRWEDSRRRVRVVFAGITVADSTHVMLLHEFGRLPVFYFPLGDVRMEVMEATDRRSHSPLKGEASYWTIRVGNRVAEDAAWANPSPWPEGRRIKATWPCTGT